MRGIKKMLLICGIILSLVMIACVGAVIHVLFGTDTYQSDDIAYYQALTGEIEGEDMYPIFAGEFDMPCPFELPALSEVEPCASYRFNYTAKRMSIFQSHAYVLVASYDAEHYRQRVDALEDRYEYLTDAFFGGGTAEDPQPEFELDGFRFRAVQEAGKDRADVKYIFLVGTSDERQEIAYVYYHDQDLDYIDTTMGEFLEEETGWKTVVK